MQLFASVRITAFRRRNYWEQAPINQQFEMKTCFSSELRLRAVISNYTCWNSVLLVLGSRLVLWEQNHFMKLIKQIKPLNATVIIQLLLPKTRKKQKRSQLLTHAGVEKYLHFHYLLRYHCHYLFFTTAKKNGMLGLMSSPSFRSQFHRRHHPPLLLYATNPLRTSPEHFWKKGTNEGQRNIIYCQRPGRATPLWP